MKKLISFVTISLCLVLISMNANAQLIGVKNIPGDYPDLAAAISDLNTVGVGAGGATLNLLPGNPQTAPAGGYIIGGAGSAVLVTSSAANPITVQGNSNTITAFSPQPTGQLFDGIFKLIGADYISITGFTMMENSSNTVLTPAASNTMTEWGVAQLHVSVTDGCQNNTIQGNTISLNRLYTNSFGIYSNNRHSATAVTIADIVTNNTTGPNSNNKIYSNSISNVNFGICFVGTLADAHMDNGNDIGGTSAATGNTVTNWGGAAPLSGFLSVSSSSFCIYANYQKNVNIAYNTLISAAVSGTSVPFRGIYSDFVSVNVTGSFTNNISNNTVTMTSGFTLGIFEAIRQAASSSGVVSAGITLNMNSNQILNCAVTGFLSQSTITCIINSAEFGVINMNNNIIQGTTSTAGSGGFIGVTNQGLSNAINLKYNQIGTAAGNAITFSAATTGVVNAVTNTSGAPGSTLTMEGNDLRGIVGGSNHSYYVNTGTNPNTNIISNTLTNLNVNNTGSSIMMISNSVTHAPGTIHNVNYNSIVNGFTKSSGSSNIWFYDAFGSSGATVTEINTGNNFSNINCPGSPFSGWRSADGGSIGSKKTITNNIFDNIIAGTVASILHVAFSDNTYASNNVSGNIISNVTSSGSTVGFLSSGHNQNFFNNVIHSLSSTGTGAVVTAISYTNGTVQNCFKNKIYNIRSNNATGSVNGISISFGTTFNIYNNLIGDLKAPSTSSSNDAIRGINVTSTTSNSNLYISYNTIYIPAQASSGANFRTSAIFHTASTTATTARLRMKNNILVNLATPGGTGNVVAYRRSSGTAGMLANYDSASNNNLFYAGIPGPNNQIYNDGTSTASTISSYKNGVFTAGTISPRDSQSDTENPNFLSIVGSSPQFLHIDPTIPTQIESSAMLSIAGITDDFDGNIRQGNAGYIGTGTAPDIGADEFEGIPLDMSPPSISYPLLSNTNSTSNRTLTGVIITDPSGVNGALGTRPRLYYKRKTDANTFVDNTSSTIGWKFSEANGATSPFDFNIDYSLLFGGTGITVGDSVQYFVVAQDLAPTPNVGINSGTFAVQPSSVALNAANFPIGGPINFYRIVGAPLAGDYTVGVLLFNRITGRNITFDRVVKNVVKDVQEIIPKNDIDKKESNKPDEYRTISKEVEEISWIPMENGKVYEEPLYVKRADNQNLPVDAGGGVYATITAAIADLNLRGASAAVRFLLKDGTYPSETLPITISPWTGASSSNTLTIKLDTAVSSISGASSSAIFVVSSADYVTIDGSQSNTANTVCPVSTATRGLIITNTSTSTTSAVIWLQTTAGDSATHNTIKNCNLVGNSNITTLFGVGAGAAQSTLFP